MATFTDSFNRADETPIGTNWQTFTGVGDASQGLGAGLNIVSNQLAAPATTGFTNISAVTTSAWTPAKTQFAKIKITTVPTGFAQFGVAVNLRNGTGRVNGFLLTWNAVEGAFDVIRQAGNFEYVSVAYSVASSIAVNDEIELRCIDNHATSANTVKLSIYKNGAIVGAEQTVTFEDSFGAGQIGVWASGGSNGAGDDFSGGSISTTKYLRNQLFALGVGA